MIKKLAGFKSAFKNNSDIRSYRFLAAIECILNQNTRDLGAATYPAINREIVRLCMEYNVGIMPIPCPEMFCLGFIRQRKPGQSIRDALDTNEGRQCCKMLSIELVTKIEDYIKNNNTLLAILGGNPESPGCAVHTTVGQDQKHVLTEKSGIFMQEFSKQLKLKSIEVPFRGIRDCQPEWLKEDLKWLEQLIAGL